MLRALLLLTGLSLAGTAFAEQAAPTVRLQTNLGDIVLQLDREKAPQTVDNFLQYARDGHYEGTIFHRVIDGFMIQGGGFTADFEQKPTRDPIPNEADNGLKNTRGTVAMARTGHPHSATAQFFINVVDNPFLDHRAPNMAGWGYAVFGEVVEGMDVVDQIRRVATGPGGPMPSDVPRSPIVIQAVSVD
ncbi:peptidyl-prolyl cis-trans isomerase [Ectothiorhodospiraceae bacterium 2226]|nr:peptidyl-prolyl cis-trans isomerase [Ectothiorhodospiraceae bacterium 2226]